MPNLKNENRTGLKKTKELLHVSKRALHNSTKKGQITLKQYNKIPHARNNEG